MVVLLHVTPIPSTVVCCQLVSCRSSPASAFSMVHKKSINLQTKLFTGLHIQGPSVLKKRGGKALKASAEIDGAGEPESTKPTEAKDENVPVEELPLESKLQLISDQKLKMKLAKKLRLRRKRLVRKRHLRKKGRWPPSKMKKNKNV